MKTIILAVMVLSAMPSVFSCENSKSAAAAGKTGTEARSDSGDTTLYRYKWVATELKGSKVPAEVKAWLMFSAGEPKKVSGNTGCNSTTGSFELRGTDTLAFKQMATTRRACIGNADGVERNFMEVLGETTKWKITGNELVLSNGITAIAKFNGRNRPAEGQGN